jgi:hypothetical protein
LNDFIVIDHPKALARQGYPATSPATDGKGIVRSGEVSDEGRAGSEFLCRGVAEAGCNRIARTIA